MHMLTIAPGGLFPQVRRAIAEMEQERERRLYQTAVSQYEMAVGVAKPGAISTPRRAL